MPTHPTCHKQLRHSRFRAAPMIVALGLLGSFGLLPDSAMSPIAQASAQQARPIPPKAQTGMLKIGVFPQAELDGRPITLGPGTRITNSKGIVVLPASIQGQSILVAYLTGPSGEVNQVWTLSQAEYKALRSRK